MRSTISIRCGQDPAGRALAVDLVALAAMGAGAWLLGVLIHGRHAVAHEAVAVLAFAAGVAAAILLAAVAGLSGSARTGRIATAVALYSGVALLVRAAGLEDPMNVWVLASCTAVLGALGMLALAVRGPVTGRAGRRAALTVGILTVVAVAAIGAVAVAQPGWMPPAWAVGGLDVVAWSGAGAAGIVALVGGTRSRRALVRRTGIAFTTLSAAHAVRIVSGGAPGGDRDALGAALELAAVGMLLVAAVAFFVAVLRGLRETEVPAPRAVRTPAPRTGADDLPDGRRDAAAPSPAGGLTIGPVTDGIRILTAARPPQAGQPHDPAAGVGRVAGGHRQWARGSGQRRARPGRGRPPGRD
ncbi:hypothetical protein [Pseudonocardia kunmingensis]|uniref:Uncharacterized protein n=1 Tax=Pseudonocardia kunmingensis TaxID=630975 RepID=A0A543DZS5_9PSEU|nr:hypothetical protein [Pseudonocardia kunmingensis]TQM14802.1 hypothetical protein FB558_1578 [Pseudonocardia kunmingensis]